MEEEEKTKSLGEVHIIGIKNVILTRDALDSIWCEEDDIL